MQESVETDKLSLEEKLKNHNWLCTLAFLADLTESLNYLNLKLQGKNQNIAQLMSHIDSFRRKLSIFKDNMEKNDPTHFKACTVINEELENADFTHFADYIEDLAKEFQTRFSDFYNMKTLQLFSNPLGSKIEEQDHDLQMELCELQSDFFLASKSNLQYEEFWKLLTNEQFPKFRKYALKVCSMFGSTYICECTFSTMKMLKTK
jgi:hypothetical protein